jgi:choloylglycine hydrolase
MVCLTLSLISSAAQLIPAESCTEVLLNKTKGLVVSGRTLDYNADIASRICFKEKGTEVTDPGIGFTTLKDKPLTWTSKYNVVLVDAFHEPVYADGMNTEGLSAACLWHLETQTANAVEAGKKGLANASLVEYIVENAATVDEARKLISNLNIFLSNYKGENMTLHWIITDRTGKSLVVELKDGKPKFYDEVSEVGVLANSPSYDEHLANLKTCESTLGKQGTVPGDYNSRSRFLKSAFLVSHMPEFKSSDEAITAATQILHNVESPKGIQPSGSYTQWIVVRDQTNLRYYLTSSKQPAPKVIDLQTIDFKQLAGKTIAVDSPTSGDISKMFPVKAASNQDSTHNE